jgi:hypothetical protein
MPARHADEIAWITVTTAACISQTVHRVFVPGGGQRPNRSTIGVANAHGSQCGKSARNKRDRACRMPSARIPKTVSVA